MPFNVIRNGDDMKQRILIVSNTLAEGGPRDGPASWLASWIPPVLIQRWPYSGTIEITHAPMMSRLNV